MKYKYIIIFSVIKKFPELKDKANFIILDEKQVEVEDDIFGRIVEPNSLFQIILVDEYLNMNNTKNEGSKKELDSLEDSVSIPTFDLEDNNETEESVVIEKNISTASTSKNLYISSSILLSNMILSLYLHHISLFIYLRFPFN